MGIKKRVSALLLAVSLSFGVCATDYLEVQALEWAGVTIGLDTALKFLLGLVGVSVGVGVADSIDWTETRENCIQFQQNQGNSAVTVSNWWADVIRGKLDTASDCWDSFKEWVKSMIKKPDPVLVHNGSINDIWSAVSNGSTFSIYGDYQDFPIDLNAKMDFSCIFVNYNSSGGVESAYFWLDTAEVTNIGVGPGPGTQYMFVSAKPVIYFAKKYGSLRINSISADTTVNGVYWQAQMMNSYAKIFNKEFISTACDNLLSGGYLEGAKRYMAEWGELDLDGSTVVKDGELDSAFPNVTDIGLGSSIATDLPQEGVLEIPWENVGDTAGEVEGAIDDAIEKVNTGVMSLTQYWEYVQNITNVYAYDITNDYLLPNDGDNETTEDKVQENVNRGAFVLAGLEKVFPFCIPWDIYAFVTLLVAEPVAPVIEYPVYNPVTDSEEIITIDFSVWEDQVIIMRYIFDFLLIIGLLLLARSLIGAGGSD